MSRIKWGVFYNFAEVWYNAIGDLEANFRFINNKSEYIRLVDEIFVDASAGPVVKYLPEGNISSVSYGFTKTDSSANTVTIYPKSPQLLLATTSLVLTTQGDSAILTFDKASQSWWKL